MPEIYTRIDPTVSTLHLPSLAERVSLFKPRPIKLFEIDNPREFLIGNYHVLHPLAVIRRDVRFSQLFNTRPSQSAKSDRRPVDTQQRISMLGIDKEFLLLRPTYEIEVLFISLA